MADVHPTAMVGDGADIAPDAKIGPHCVIEGEVRIGPGTVLGPGCVVRGPVTIGAGNTFHGHCYLDASADKKRDGVGGSLVIGDGNVVREFATLNRATAAGDVTTVGDGNLLMPYTHVAHDCVLGDGIVLANQAQLGGEVSVGDRANLGGGAMVHQRCRIGTLAMVGVSTFVNKDVPPYAKYAATPMRVTVGVNRVGLERAGMADQIDAVSGCYRILYGEGLRLDEAVERIGAQSGDSPCVAVLSGFLAGVGERGLVRPRRAQVRE